MSGNPKLQPNGWWEQDRVGPASKFHRAGQELAAFCNKAYDPLTREFYDLPPEPEPVPQHPKQQYRDPKTGRFAKRPKNKIHHHPPKKRANA